MNSLKVGHAALPGAGGGRPVPAHMQGGGGRGAGPRRGLPCAQFGAWVRMQLTAPLTCAAPAPQRPLVGRPRPEPKTGAPAPMSCPSLQTPLGGTRCAAGQGLKLRGEEGRMLRAAWGFPFRSLGAGAPAWPSLPAAWHAGNASNRRVPQDVRAAVATAAHRVHWLRRAAWADGALRQAVLYRGSSINCTSALSWLCSSRSSRDGQRREYGGWMQGPRKSAAAKE